MVLQIELLKQNTVKIKIGTQVPRDLHRRLKTVAAQDGVSMDDLFTFALEDFLKKKRGGKCVYDRLCAIERKIDSKIAP